MCGNPDRSPTSCRASARIQSWWERRSSILGRAVVMATSLRSTLHGFVALEAAGAHAVEADHFEALVDMLVATLPD